MLTASFMQGACKTGVPCPCLQRGEIAEVEKLSGGERRRSILALPANGQHCIPGTASVLHVPDDEFIDLGSILLVTTSDVLHGGQKALENF